MLYFALTQSINIGLVSFLILNIYLSVYYMTINKLFLNNKIMTYVVLAPNPSIVTGKGVVGEKQFKPLLSTVIKFKYLFEKKNF